MEMTLRWYGSKFDTVTLKQIRQIPGVTGVITTLYDTEPGEVWSRERIRAMKEEVEAAGLNLSGIESVNIHDAIKTGAPEREQYIANYIETLENILTGSLRSLFAVAENYPDLKANANFAELQRELSDIEDEIAGARRYYNGVVNKFNTKTEVFPSNLVAAMFGFKRKPLYEVNDAAERENVKVSF